MFEIFELEDYEIPEFNNEDIILLKSIASEKNEIESLEKIILCNNIKDNILIDQKTRKKPKATIEKQKKNNNLTKIKKELTNKNLDKMKEKYFTNFSFMWQCHLMLYL